MEEHRATAREVAQRHLAKGDPFGWFEALYALGDPGVIPWADLAPNPSLVEWLDRGRAPLEGTAVKVGCGLGDDAEELSRRGLATTAFDISPTAIEWSRRRFPSSCVEYIVADLFSPPESWIAGFDLVVESYTLQVLPPSLRTEACRRIAALVAPGGTLVVIARGREAEEPEGKMPWPLVVSEFETFDRAGLRRVSFEDFVDRETPPVRRFRLEFRRLESQVAEPRAPVAR